MNQSKETIKRNEVVSYLSFLGKKYKKVLAYFEM